jgi:predicted nucleic acid-binding protein
MTRAFLDTNVLIYAFGWDARKARALDLLRAGGVISVQSLNEFANVARRKLAMSWPEVRTAIDAIRVRCPETMPLFASTHAAALALAENYKLAVFDASLVASALEAGCTTFYSEDMHDGLVVDGRLRIVNPFG